MNRPFVPALRPTCRRWLAVASLAVLGAGASAAEPAGGGGFSAGLSVQPTATPAEIGLPLYPGARPYRESGEDGAGATLALWGGAFGMQLQTLKLRSPDSVDDLSTFYREAMSRHGKVLECTAESAAEPTGHDDSALRCGKDQPPAGGRLFKVGLPRSMRIVTIEPVAGVTQVQLVHLRIRGE